MSQLAAYIRGGAKRASGGGLPTNILRWAMSNKDKELALFIEMFDLDRMATHAGQTFIIPAGGILDKLTKQADKKKVESPEYQKAKEQAERYVLKGATIPEQLRMSGWYVSLAGEAYYVVADKGKLYFHTSPVSGSESIKKGFELQVAVITQSGSVVLTCATDLPKGAPPKAAPSDERKPRPKKAFAHAAYMFGGSKSAESTNLINRWGIFEHAVKEHGEKASAFVVGSFMKYLEQNDAKAYEAAKALMTGAAHVDAMLLLEYMTENEELRDASRESNYLIADEHVTNWANDVMDYDVDWKAHYDTLLESMDANNGLSAKFAKKRTARRGQLKKKPRAGKGRRMEDVAAEAFTDLHALYSVMGESNKFEGEQVFSEPVYGYLADRFGADLGSYLHWHNTLFASYDVLNQSAMGDLPQSDWMEHANLAMPGQNFAEELARMESVDTSAKFAHFEDQGYMPYFRCDCGDITLAEVDGQVIAPAEFEGFYRSSEFSAAHKRRPVKRRTTRRRLTLGDEVLFDADTDIEIEFETVSDLQAGGAKKKKGKVVHKKKKSPKHRVELGESFEIDMDDDFSYSVDMMHKHKKAKLKGKKGSKSSRTKKAFDIEMDETFEIFMEGGKKKAKKVKKPRRIELDGEFELSEAMDLELFMDGGKKKIRSRSRKAEPDSESKGKDKAKKPEDKECPHPPSEPTAPTVPIEPTEKPEDEQPLESYLGF